MKTERYESDQGEFRCFGFPNALVGKEGVREILSRVPGIKIKYLDKNWGVDIFCEFSYNGKQFYVSEPYGDNSYYDITCDESNTKELEDIYELFVSASVPTKRQWLKIAWLIAVASLIGFIIWLI